MKPVAESYRKQKQFITDAGHEIKTPLTVIGANTELIEMLSGESEWTKGIKEQIERLKNLTEKLIFLAKTEEQTNISMFEFSLTDAVRETIQSFAAVAASRNISLTTDIQNDLCYIGNEEMIRQLVSLLTDNALKYTDGDTVAVTLRAENGKRILETRNRASYMRDGSLNGVFERFARGDSSRNSQTGGHGIGLSVSKAIVEAHKGKIKGECRSGIVTFTVIL
jgi:signal transduction histidine kinase